MTPSQFNHIRSLVYEQAGITLGPGKESLVQARIGKRLRALDLPDITAYLAHLETDRSGEELVQLLDAISTNVTSFYREEDHFRHLAELARTWLSEGRKRWRLWCAASSSGEEPWTLAMTLAPIIDGLGVDLGILATDISTKVLRLAITGEYAAERIKPVPMELRQRYLERLPDGRYRVGAALRPFLTYRRLNLAKPPYPMRGPLDAIFCRNVMIYFDQDGRQRLVHEARRLLRPGGILVVGHAESLTGIHQGFRVLRPSMYVREDG